MTKTKELKELEEKNKAVRLAREHWEWLGPTLEKIYKDAFIHGYKHGRSE